MLAIQGFFLGADVGGTIWHRQIVPEPRCVFTGSGAEYKKGRTAPLLYSERVGFEPTCGCPQTDFESYSFMRISRNLLEISGKYRNEKCPKYKGKSCAWLCNYSRIDDVFFGFFSNKKIDAKKADFLEMLLEKGFSGSFFLIKRLLQRKSLFLKDVSRSYSDCGIWWNIRARKTIHILNLRDGEHGKRILWTYWNLQ